MKTIATCVALLLAATPGLSFKLTPGMKTFGHSIKNGHLLPAGNEITTFEHNCTTGPCAITQLHCPTAGPTGWQNAVVRVYVDGEASPSINVTLLELANVGSYNGQSGDSQPWGNGLFGHTAQNGGVYSTMRIPFGGSVRTTIESAEARAGTFWFIVRGVEAYPVQLGDLQLPDAARLKLHRFNARTAPQQLVTIADVPRGTAGAVVNVKFDAAGSGSQQNLGFLEACMRAHIDQAPQPTFLSSGAEDYFLSAYYFNEGTFKTPASGLTYKADGKVSAYKVHDRDPLLFSDGLKLVFRNGETTTGCGDEGHCPDQWCSPGAEPAGRGAAAAAPVAYDEYFLGGEGASCSAACGALALFCAADMALGDQALMRAHLNVSDCWRNASTRGGGNPEQWWAPDQPNYVSGAFNNQSGKPEPNYRQCLGFVGYPAESDCAASFPTARRVCHCVRNKPPTPPPTPAPPAPAPGADYDLLVWAYEWPAGSGGEGSGAEGAGAEKQRQEQVQEQARALRLVGRLAAAGALAESEEDALVDAITGPGALRLTALAAALEAAVAGEAGAGAWSAARAARQLKRVGGLAEV
eukprot:g6755.t1